MKLPAGFVMLALAGCGGGGSANVTDGGGGGGGGGSGGGAGGAPTPCTLTISGPVTTGSYASCHLFPAPEGGNVMQVSAERLPGCDGCSFIAQFDKTLPTDHCHSGTASIQDDDPLVFPDAILMAATSTDQMASCTINTTQLDLVGSHWSGSITAFLVATDFNFMLVGLANVTVTGSF
ncbi:MAG TPA: hypothetical protein VN947_14890 [Polyangia bacterium]|nr:hypothetical protein [Polyangia bacterium]